MMSSLPYVSATTFMFIWSRRSDQKGERFFHMILPLCIAVIGFMLLGKEFNVHITFGAIGIHFEWKWPVYLFTFIPVTGTIASNVLLLACTPYYCKGSRAVAIALINL